MDSTIQSRPRRLLVRCAGTIRLGKAVLHSRKVQKRVRTSPDESATEMAGMAASCGTTGASTGTASQRGSLGKTSGSFSSGEGVATGRSPLSGAGASQTQGLSSQQLQRWAGGQDFAGDPPHATFIPGTKVHRNKRSRAMNARDFIYDPEPVSPLGEVSPLVYSNGVS